MFGSLGCFIFVTTLVSLMLTPPTSVFSAQVYSRIPLPGYCKQPPPRSEGRSCTIDIEGFYYDQRTEDCQLYEVGGCRTIPGQSFGSRDDCLATCVYRTRNIQELFTIK